MFTWKCCSCSCPPDADEELASLCLTDRIILFFAAMSTPFLWTGTNFHIVSIMKTSKDAYKDMHNWDMAGLSYMCKRPLHRGQLFTALLAPACLGSWFGMCNGNITNLMARIFGPQKLGSEFAIMNSAATLASTLGLLVAGMPEEHVRYSAFYATGGAFMAVCNLLPFCSDLQVAVGSSTASTVPQSNASRSDSQDSITTRPV